MHTKGRKATTARKGNNPAPGNKRHHAAKAERPHHRAANSARVVSKSRRRLIDQSADGQVRHYVDGNGRHAMSFAGEALAELQNIAKREGTDLKGALRYLSVTLGAALAELPPIESGPTRAFVSPTHGAENVRVDGKNIIITGPKADWLRERCGTETSAAMKLEDMVARAILSEGREVAEQGIVIRVRAGTWLARALHVAKTIAPGVPLACMVQGWVEHNAEAYRDQPELLPYMAKCGLDYYNGLRVRAACAKRLEPAASAAPKKRN